MPETHCVTCGSFCTDRGRQPWCRLKKKNVWASGTCERWHKPGSMVEPP